VFPRRNFLLDEWRRVYLGHFNRGISSVASVDDGSSYSLAGCHEGCGLGARAIRDANGCISRAEVRCPDVVLRRVMLEQSYAMERDPTERNIAKAEPFLGNSGLAPALERGVTDSVGPIDEQTASRALPITDRLPLAGLGGDRHKLNLNVAS